MVGVFDKEGTDCPTRVFGKMPRRLLKNVLL
jgi:hypothetical protein